MQQYTELISIITPCHNSATFIHRLFDSILKQTYPHIEMFCIDNDSKDNTADIIKSYIPLFKSKGYNLSYIHQENLGPSAAVRNGLQYIQGDYLIVPDSDDYFAVNNFFCKMVDKFKELPDNYGIVRCQEQEIEDGTFSELGIIGKGLPEYDSGNLFEDCLIGKNGYYYPGVGYLYKVKALKNSLKSFDIYAAYNIGQNRQLMLPVLYSYKCYTIQEPLVNYLVRSNSISHGDYLKYQIKKELYKQEKQYINTILHSIKQISANDIEKYKKIYLYFSSLYMADFALSNNNLKDTLFFINEAHLYHKISTTKRIAFLVKILLKKIKK